MEWKTDRQHERNGNKSFSTSLCAHSASQVFLLTPISQDIVEMVRLFEPKAPGQTVSVSNGHLIMTANTANIKRDFISKWGFYSDLQKWETMQNADDSAETRKNK